MAKATQDYTKMMKDMMGAFPVDTSAMQEAFKTQASFADRMSKVVLEAAEKSTEISASWTKATIGKLGVVTNVKEDPADYTKAMTDFASAQAEMSAEFDGVLRRDREEGPDGNRRVDARRWQGHG